MNSLARQIRLQPATLVEYPIIQNLARFYVYDMSRSCGFISPDWICPADGLYESYDFKTYFEDPTCSAYLITVNEELAGFVLLNKKGVQPSTDWNVGEFFILAKFQGQGVGRFVAEELWTIFPGIWEISVIPENKAALAFWRNTVLVFTSGLYTETLVELNETKPHYQRYILRFNTNELAKPEQDNETIKIQFVDELSPELEERMSQGCIAYEKSLGIDVNYKPFSILLFNKQGVVCGVIKAYTAFSEVYIDDIWVDSPFRGNGYGRKLLAALEERFTGKGFNNINLVTSAFQAPAFYKKCGYTLEYVRKNEVNPQLSKAFFVKFFPDQVQNQGLIINTNEKKNAS
ncbi:GNAT family N-acetyltransferase [Legionella sp. km772]|uniref:GNAT family N-acetyltransferase n=1 Tax=Legionella sp. km772 TaxID=2498111 RepID=UPI000F8CBE7A|nr:GNAT family N-acetyltransferase [Legionella sp. km772]RUR13814.1 GNAT family N-acetyltransferase [Legionella sp. km772]